ncbi:MAG: LysR family transcriptional regulator [Xylophilus ampelinus]
MASISPALVPPLNLEQLRKFAQVVAHGSFTAAAEHLGLTQPAVSQQIHSLERQLGVRLLERVGRSVAPTAAGADLLRHLPGIQAAMDAAFDAVRAHARDIAGTVRIGTGGTACLYLLPPALRALREAHPRLDLVVSTGNTDDLVRRVEDNRLDLALVTLPVASRAVALLPLLQDEIVAVRRRGTAAPWPARPGPAALCELPLVTFGTGVSTRALVDAWFGRRDRKPRPSMELDSVEAIKAVVAAGIGYGLLPRMAVAGAGGHPDLEIARVSPPLRRSQAIALRHDKPMGRALRAVVDAVAEAGRAYGAAPEPSPAATGPAGRRGARAKA